MNIKVRWRVAGHHPSVKSWHQFTRVIETVDAEDRDLGFPPGTSAYLKAGFEARLGRSVGWQLDASENNTEGFCAAARVFKRGVPCRIGDHLRTVPDGVGSYEIVSANVVSQLQSGAFPPSLFLVDENLVSHFPSLLNLQPKCLVRVSEDRKTLATVAEIRAFWEKSGHLQHWTIIGGGCLGDLGAFAATLSGCSFELIPTTLLAMVDACVGGKTGVNFPPYGKNQIGLFAFPTRVMVDTSFLASLSPRQFRSGIAECIKHAILFGNRDAVDSLCQASRTMDRSLVSAMLEELISFKADIVRQDPDERGIRVILNFGHTLGHAIESLSIARMRNNASVIMHGEAVALGMVLALLLSQKVAGFPPLIASDLIGLLKKSMILPRRADFAQMLAIGEFEVNDQWPTIAAMMLNDKKNQNLENDGVDWVLLKDLGEVNHAESTYLTRYSVNGLQVLWSELLSMI